MSERQRPLPITTQWPEGRGFRRLYLWNPHNQARFVMGLLGLKEEIELLAPDEVHKAELDAAVGVVLRAFAEEHPEFLTDQERLDSDVGGGSYHADSQLIEYFERATEVS